MTYMNQIMKRPKATPNAASTMMKNVTPPATAPELLPGASALAGGIPSIMSMLGLK